MQSRFALFLLMLSMISLQSYAGADLTQGLVAYYPFSGNANDASGNGNNAIFNNATLTSDRLGNANSAYYFNGVDNYIQIPNSNSLNPSGTITLCAWVKPMGFYQGNCHGNSIIMKGDQDYLQGNYALRFDDNQYTYGANCINSVVDSLHQNFYSSFWNKSGGYTPYIQKNTWYSVVTTYDGTWGKMYVNCSLVDSFYSPGLSFSNGYDLFLGKLNYPIFPYWFNGVMDEVRIYNRALNQDEVNLYGGCSIVNSGNCGNNWLNVTNYKGGVQIGDLDIPGNVVTVEAKFNRSIPYNGGRFYAGDIVSKHNDPTDVNYLLRPSSAQITTTNGYFATPAICDIDLNKTYYVAMVYDGSTLKFYRNGFLMSQVNATGNLIQNNWLTKIGDLASNPGYGNEGLVGFIDEVRIWNVARTQDELRTYMDQSLPNPNSQPGLLAYYTFDDLKNKQGNTAWDGTVFGNAQIQQQNPTCSSFIADSCNLIVTTNPLVNADFDLPDTVCVNTPISIKNKTTGGTNFYWNFCEANVNTTPSGVNLGNIGSALSSPVFSDLAEYNGNFYAFVVNYYPGGLIRLDFGNSYLNTPTVVNLGDIGGVMNYDHGSEGIQVVQNNGNWYAIIVGGSPQNSTSTPKVITISFGTDLTNTNPVGYDWGNIGNLLQCIDLYMFSDNGSWYGFTTNSENNTITKFNFSNNLDNAPTGVNLGDLGVLNYPTGVFTINNNGNWYVFVTNGGNDDLVRLDFGNSLLNNPTAVDLGNPGGLLHKPRDITIMKFCGQIVGFVVNGDPNYYDIVKLDFNNDLLNTPSAVSLGNIGNFDFPHSISKIFREDADLYTFVTNVYNNTITRLKFSGCTNASVPNSSDSIPAQITYNAAGVYNINLLVDEGLPTQTSVCKSITVVPSPQKTPLFDTGYCTGDSVLLTTNFPPDLQWNNGSTDTSLAVHTPGYYWVESNYYGCVVRDSFNVTQNISPVVNLGKDTSLCYADSLLLNAGNPGAKYKWQDGSAGQTYNSKQSGKYSVLVTNSSGCKAADTISVTVAPQIVLNTTNNTTICAGDSIRLSTTNTSIKTFHWSPGNSLSDSIVYNPIAKPSDTTVYIVAITDNNGCKAKDSVTIAVAPLPVVSTLADSAVCYGGNIVLQTTATSGVNFSWSPSSDLSDAGTASPVASPLQSTQYIVTVKTAAGCIAKDSVQIAIKPLPVISTSIDTLICTGFSANLFVNATGAAYYSWTPSTGLNNTTINNPVATPATTTVYHVQVTAINSCAVSDSIVVNVKQKPVFAINPTSASLCTGQSAVFTASGGDTYQWYPPDNISDPFSSIVTVSPITNTQYSAIVTDNICFVTDTLYANVTVGQLSQYSLSKSNDIDCVIGQSKLTATGGLQYEWSPGFSLSDSTIANPVATPTQTTTYHIKITNADGCTAEDTIQVKVLVGAVENGYKLPGAFTPNSDMVNDCFGVKEWGALTNLDFSVYNRWGNLIFHTNNPSECWDGTYKGTLQPPGAYVYQIRAHAICGTVYRKGTVVLVR